MADPTDQEEQEEPTADAEPDRNAAASPPDYFEQLRAQHQRRQDRSRPGRPQPAEQDQG